MQRLQGGQGVDCVVVLAPEVVLGQDEDFLSVFQADLALHSQAFEYLTDFGLPISLAHTLIPKQHLANHRVPCLVDLFD